MPSGLVLHLGGRDVSNLCSAIGSNVMKEREGEEEEESEACAGEGVEV